MVQQLRLNVSDTTHKILDFLAYYESLNVREYQPIGHSDCSLAVQRSHTHLSRRLNEC